MEEVLCYVKSIRLNQSLNDAKEKVKKSRQATSNWTTRPEVIQAGDAIERLAFLELSSPTILDLDETRYPEFDDRASQIRTWRGEYQQAAESWNEAVNRGNWRIDMRWQLLELNVEQWIIENTQPGIWFDDFAHWVQPYIDGGYGLYCDCEVTLPGLSPADD